MTVINTIINPTNFVVVCYAGETNNYMRQSYGIYAHVYVCTCIKIMENQNL